KEHLPVPFHKLMTSQDSEIIDFYPNDFTIDLNGKRYAWQGVVLLPFIEESRLLKAVESVYPHLEADEIARNALGSEILCFSNKHKLYEELCVLYSLRSNEKPVALDPMISDKLVGFVTRDPNCIPDSTFCTPLSGKNTHDIVNDKSLSVTYYLPAKTSSHKSILLRNVKLDPPMLTREDYDFRRGGGRGRGRGRGGGSPRGGHSYYRDGPVFRGTHVPRDPW
ncbi:12817_t:CDS:2, partial [Dentiscutata heterogama]